MMMMMSESDGEWLLAISRSIAEKPSSIPESPANIRRWKLMLIFYCFLSNQLAWGNMERHLGFLEGTKDEVPKGIQLEVEPLDF